MYSGWANNCGVELFTYGWVRCDVPIPRSIPIPPSISGDDRVRRTPQKAKQTPQLLPPLQVDNIKAIIEEEDEELLTIVSLLVSSGIIQ
jgi:hypothetical protein